MSKIYRFDCNGGNSPAYGCDKPGDNSGQYYQAEDVVLMERMISELELLLMIRDGGSHDVDCKVNRPSIGICNCGHKEVLEYQDRD